MGWIFVDIGWHWKYWGSLSVFLSLYSNSLIEMHSFSSSQYELFILRIFILLKS